MVAVGCDAAKSMCSGGVMIEIEDKPFEIGK